jgi:hypothetical protein
MLVELLPLGLGLRALGRCTPILADALVSETFCRVPAKGAGPHRPLRRAAVLGEDELDRVGVVRPRLLREATLLAPLAKVHFALRRVRTMRPGARVAAARIGGEAAELRRVRMIRPGAQVLLVILVVGKEGPRLLDRIDPAPVEARISQQRTCGGLVGRKPDRLPREALAVALPAVQLGAQGLADQVLHPPRSFALFGGSAWRIHRLPGRVIKRGAKGDGGHQPGRKANRAGPRLHGSSPVPRSRSEKGRDPTHNADFTLGIARVPAPRDALQEHWRAGSLATEVGTPTPAIG